MSSTNSLTCSGQSLITGADYLVRSPCSVPNSPICLLDNGLVTVSTGAAAAPMADPKRVWSFNLKTYCRKRKRNGLDPAAATSVPAAKRKLILPSSRIEDASHEEQSKKDVVVEASSLEANTCVPMISEVKAVDDAKVEDDVSAKLVLQNENSGFGDTLRVDCDVVERERRSKPMESFDVDGLFVPNSSSNDSFPGFITKSEVESRPASFPEENRQRNVSAWETLSTDYNLCRSLLSGVPWEDCKHQTALGTENEDDVYGRKKGIKLSLASKRLFQHSGAQNDSLLRSQVTDINPRKENTVSLVEAQANSSSQNQPSKSLSKNFLPERVLLTESSLEYSKDLHIEPSGAQNDSLLLRSQVNDINSRKENNASKVEALANSSSQKQPTKSLIKNFLPKRGVLTGSSEYNKDLNVPQRRDQKVLYLKGNSEYIKRPNADGKENTIKAKTVFPKEKLVEQKEVPQFDDFIIEDEEGSGGYGTVYRARRKSDGKMCAIKCPHAKAHKNHVTNELKMLERFGGRNFIVKYEGSMKKGNTECFILEHVDHDRPEVLKKEIDVFQLQWYAYCLFRALSILHKQAVVHRDVKPGNFLFSRKQNKGVLVDFNLSMDLQQKHAVGSKSKSSSYASSYVPPPHPKSTQSTKDNKFATGVRLAGNLQEATTHKKPIHEHNKRLKKMASSGVNSTKDATSTRSPSTERATREPLPSLGRKELISLVQDARQSPNRDDAIKSTQFSQRKRIAAPPSNRWYMTPMPLYSNCVAVAGAGLLKSKGDGKRKTEGPCFGTKGFRAPEVLFKSLHQGLKIDVWSAGATILSLMIGRSPFTGDPEQNVKEIAKLRGSEDLWEVAKLHDRESSFPMELMDSRFLPATELQSWCKAHTRRPDFLKLIPRSLFDLIDKCLAVNPRLRISAEEALRHEFFDSCHESMTKQRMLRHETKRYEDHLSK